MPCCCDIRTASDQALIRGVEVEVQADLQRELMLQVAAHLQRGKAVDDDAPLDDISPATISTQLTKAFGLRGFAYVRGAVCCRPSLPV